MVTRVPPYDLQYNWRRFSDLGRVDSDPGLTPVSRELGRAEFDIASGGMATTHRGLGIYFRPRSPNGILNLSSNVSYVTYYYNAGIFNGAVTRAWLGFVVESFNVTDEFFDRGLVTQRHMIIDRDIAWWIGNEANTLVDDSFPINTQVRVDDRHFYIVWVLCGGFVRGARDWSSGYVHFGMHIPSITWSYSVISV